MSLLDDREVLFVIYTLLTLPYALIVAILFMEAFPRLEVDRRKGTSRALAITSLIWAVLLPCAILLPSDAEAHRFLIAILAGGILLRWGYLRIDSRARRRSQGRD